LSFVEIVGTFLEFLPKISDFIVAVIFPPLAVGILDGCSCSLLIDVILTILGWLPGVIYAFYVICRDGGRLGSGAGASAQPEKVNEQVIKEPVVGYNATEQRA